MRIRKVLLIAAAVLVTIFAISLPGIIQGRQQHAAFEQVFHEYSAALIAGDYSKAYGMCGQEFRAGTTFEQFQQQQQKVRTALGRITTINEKGFYVHGKGSPMNWIAIVQADETHERGIMRDIIEFHREPDGWRMFGYKSEQQ